MNEEDRQKEIDEDLSYLPPTQRRELTDADEELSIIIAKEVYETLKCNFQKSPRDWIKICGIDYERRISCPFRKKNTPPYFKDGEKYYRCSLGEGDDSLYSRELLEIMSKIEQY